MVSVPIAVPLNILGSIVSIEGHTKNREFVPSSLSQIEALNGICATLVFGLKRGHFPVCHKSFQVRSLSIRNPAKLDRGVLHVYPRDRVPLEAYL